MPEPDQSKPTRVRMDQPTLKTLEETMAEAHAAALKCFRTAGFTKTMVVVNVFTTSLDPDDDVTTWSAGSKIPHGSRADRNMLGKSLQRSSEEAWHA